VNIVPPFSQRWRRLTLSVHELTVERNHASLYQIVTVGGKGIPLFMHGDVVAYSKWN